MKSKLTYSEDKHCLGFCSNIAFYFICLLKIYQQQLQQQQQLQIQHEFEEKAPLDLDDDDDDDDDDCDDRKDAGKNINPERLKAFNVSFYLLSYFCMERIFLFLFDVSNIKI